MLKSIPHTLVTFLVIFLLVLSIVCQIIIGVLYQNMIKESDNMSSTQNKLLKQCKLKFSNCYQLNLGVLNVPIFVDKYLNKLKFFGLPLSSFGHFSGQLMLLSVFMSGLGICKGIIEGMTIGELLPYYIISLFGLYLYFSVSSLVDANGKKKILKTSLVDFLENHMANRMDNTRLEPPTQDEKQPVTKRRAEFITMDVADSPKVNGEPQLEPVDDYSREAIKESIMQQDSLEEEIKNETTKRLFGKKEEQELEELLKEFFV